MKGTKRRELQALLQTLCSNVYFQPPASVRMSYPAIKFARDDLRNTHANDEVYQQSQFYVITVIESDADAPIADKVSKLPTARFDRRYTADGLYHEVYRIYY